MIAIRKANESEPKIERNCHGGSGELLCHSLLSKMESEKFSFMHYDEMKAGTSIGIHKHEGSEEIYFLSSGKGILTFDGEEYEMNPGDVSLCKSGHSHGFMATEDTVLIVVG